MKMVSHCSSHHYFLSKVSFALSPTLIRPNVLLNRSDAQINRKKMKRNSHTPRRREREIIRYVFHPSDTPPSNKSAKLEKCTQLNRNVSNQMNHMDFDKKGKWKAPNKNERQKSRTSSQLSHHC